MFASTSPLTSERFITRDQHSSRAERLIPGSFRGEVCLHRWEHVFLTPYELRRQRSAGPRWILTTITERGNASESDCLRLRIRVSETVSRAPKNPIQICSFGAGTTN